jgi:hypothetical protein
MSSTQIYVQEDVIEVSVEDDYVQLSAYSGAPVTVIQNEIDAQSPLFYNSLNNNLSINQSLLNVGVGQVSGLGTVATRNVPSTGNAAPNEVVLGSDTRLSASTTQMPFGVNTGIPGHYLVSVGTGVVNQLIPEYSIFYVPLWISGSAQVDLIAIEVASSATASGTARIGLYSVGENGLPGTLLQDAGSVDTSTVGIKQAVISQNISGLVYAAVVAQSGNAILKSLINTMHAYPSPTTGATSASKLSLSSTAAVYGALPLTAPAPFVGISYYNPIVNLRLA